MKIKLGDIFEIGSGGTPSKLHPEYYNGNIPWVKTGDLKNEYLYEVENFITEEGLRNSSAKMYEEDTVLIAMYGATIGAVSILKMKACTNQACAAFKKNKQVIPEYLYYFLKGQKEKFVKDSVGGAQPNISSGYLKRVEMELPLLEKQREIVNILNRINGILCKRNQEILVLDDLVRARFIELFGDPVSNPYGYDKVRLSELADIKIGPFGSLLHKEDYIENGHPLLNPSHIIDGKVVPDRKLSISDEKYEELSAYQLQAGDVVMGRRGEMGRCAVVADEGFLCGTGSMVIRTKGEVTADFLQKIISFPTFKKTIEDMAVGQTMPNLNVPIVSSFQIIKPPIEVQNRYYEFVDQVNKSKVKVQKALDETQKLFDSLMQQYFG